MLRLLRVPALLSLAAIAACVSIPPIDVAPPGVAPPEFETFTLVEPQLLLDRQIDEATKARLADELADAAREGLLAQGHREVQADPDVLVVVSAVSRINLPPSAERQRNVQVFNPSVLDPNRTFENASITPPDPHGAGRDGDLILSVLDPATKATLWQAVAMGAASSPREALRNARATFKAMAEKLPPPNP